MLAVGCHSGRPSSTEPPPAPPDTPFATPPAPTRADDTLERELAALERELTNDERRLLAELAERPAAADPAVRGGATPQQAPAPAAPKRKRETRLEVTRDDRISGAPAAEAEAKPAPATEDATSGCDLACRALQSMRRSAERICTLSGEATERCARARSRVDAARARVVEAGCRCDDG